MINSNRVGARLSPRYACVVACQVVAFLCATVAAQESPTADSALRVTVLRSGASDLAAVGDSIDAALLRDLPAIAGIDHAQLSPIEYEEIQLTVGCEDQSRACLAAIAGMTQVNGLVVRSVVKSGDALQLDLVYFDTSSQDEPSHATITGNAEALVNAVPSLVRKLFGIPEVSARAVDAPESRQSAPSAATAASSESSSGVNGLMVGGIAALGVGVTVATLGVLIGASASSSFDEYKSIQVTDRETARRASRKFDDADSKATLANILMPIGGVLAIGGAVMLVLGLGADSTDSNAAHVSVAPVALPGVNGGALMISGAL